jgi:hypothetical protein
MAPNYPGQVDSKHLERAGDRNHFFIQLLHSSRLQITIYPRLCKISAKLIDSLIVVIVRILSTSDFSSAEMPPETRKMVRTNQ